MWSSTTLAATLGPAVCGCFGLAGRLLTCGATAGYDPPEVGDCAMSDLPLNKKDIQGRLGQSAFIELLNLTGLSADPVKQELVMRAAMHPEFERGRGSGQ